jgi:PAS domain S-box-containing protein
MSAVAPIRLLAVDDNEATRYMVARMLRRGGFEVMEAKTGREALELARATMPDLVLLDVQLPDLNGIEVCRRLKTDRATAGIPVLHLSASYTRGEDKVVGLEGGADGYLTHPIEGPELIATIRALLRARSAEEKAIVAAQQWQATFDAIGDPVCLVDGEGNLLRCNGAMSALLGTPSEDAVGHSLLDRLEYAVGAPDRPALARLWTTEHGEPEEVRVGARWFRAAASVVRDRWGARMGIVVVLTETTHRRETEEAQRFLAEASMLLAASLDYRTTLASIARLIVRSLADFCEIALANDQGEVTRTEIVHAKPELEPLVLELEAVAGHDAAWRDGMFDRVLRTGRPMASAVPDPLAAQPEHPRAAILRAVAPVSIMMVPLFARGRMLGVITFAATGDRRPYGDAELRLAEELVRRAALAVDNARLYEAALVANKAKADFLAVMSHELRTPLNAMLGYADLMEHEIAGPVTAGQRDQIARIKLSGRHLLTLIDEVLTFTRLEAGKEAIFVERADAAVLAREAAAIAEPLAAARGLALRLELPEHPVAALTDPSKVRQVLVNLLSNAVKFTPAGSVTLAVSGDDRTVRFDVRDTGIGIAPDYLDRIFDPFWQVEQTQTRRVGGSGIGLSVVRRLARMLGGDVEVRSKVGDGSTFSLVLPLDAGARPLEGPPVPRRAGVLLDGLSVSRGSGVVERAERIVQRASSEEAAS